MKESEGVPVFDRWIMTDDSNITLESPMVAIGSGHLDLYLEDPENAFGGLGIAIKMTLPDSVAQAFQKCEERGERLHIHLTAQGVSHDFVLAHSSDAGRYPWRLIKE